MSHNQTLLWILAHRNHSRNTGFFPGLYQHRTLILLHTQLSRILHLYLATFTHAPICLFWSLAFFSLSLSTPPFVPSRSAVTHPVLHHYLYAIISLPLFPRRTLNSRRATFWLFDRARLQPKRIVAAARAFLFSLLLFLLFHFSEIPSEIQRLTHVPAGPFYVGSCVTHIGCISKVSHFHLCMKYVSPVEKFCRVTKYFHEMCE